MEKLLPVLAKMSRKNQIVIPSMAREFLELSEGSRVALIPKGNVLIMIKKPKSYKKALAGILDQKVLNKSLESLKADRETW